MTTSALVTTTLAKYDSAAAEVLGVVPLGTEVYSRALHDRLAEAIRTAFEAHGGAGGGTVMIGPVPIREADLGLVDEEGPGRLALLLQAFTAQDQTVIDGLWGWWRLTLGQPYPREAYAAIRDFNDLLSATGEVILLPETASQYIEIRQGLSWTAILLLALALGAAGYAFWIYRRKQLPRSEEEG